MLKNKLTGSRVIAFSICLGWLILFSSHANGVTQESLPEHQSQTHEASISAQLLPVFAVDADGNPVYDLKMAEMELFVDGKPTPILFFEGYHVELNATPGKTSDAANPPPSQVKTPERITFIIMDTLISNFDILSLTKRVAMEIIKHGSSGEAFVLLESNPLNGFQYVAGPTKNKKELLDSLINLKKNHQRRDMYTTGMVSIYMKDDDKDFKQALAEIDQLKTDKEKEMYLRDVSNFAKGLKQLKYALKSTTLPKTVFLITAQSQLLGAAQNPLTYLTLLEEAAQAVNYGGSIFYLINPLPQRQIGQGAELKFMADAAGGKFFSGTGVKDIVNQVDRNTSAYYEMAFTPHYKEGQKNNIAIKCKRPGVSLTHIIASEQERTYATMNATERKMYILNVVFGGIWSQTTIPIKKLNYKSLKPAQGTDTQKKELELSLPVATNNRNFHFYQVAVDETTQKADIIFNEKIVTGKEQVVMNTREGKKNFLVLIDTAGTVCFCSQVI